MFKLTAFAIAGAAALAIASGAMGQTAAAPTTVNQILSQTYGPETLQNQPATGGPDFNQGELIQVSGGCGPNGWRGPWGHCHYARYWGPTWGGPYGPVRWNGCPPGYWRGPWGHCRDTPYHGALPGGGWK
ncbi:MAG: hypothetical protein ABSD80_13500 [Caulobacteraceae bacterium]|jgi:hypothetical protein